MFDGSAIPGWRDVSHSEMILIPELATAVLDPFCAQPSLILIADVAEPGSGFGYEHCPRSLAKRATIQTRYDPAREYRHGRRGQGVGKDCFFSIFDDVRSDVTANEAFWRVDSEEGSYNGRTRTIWTTHLPQTWSSYLLTVIFPSFFIIASRIRGPPSTNYMFNSAL